jgi:ankyrin repeat protein
MTRTRNFLLPIALAASFAVPLAAQGFSEGFAFLKAVRERDGTKVQGMVANPSSSVINTRDGKSGEGALHILVQDRNLEWLAFMLSRGARPDLQANDGTTPLGLAAQFGWVEGATQLIARGAKVDQANNRGETPLILAIQARQLAVPERVAMIRLLISQGADPRRQDSFAGYSALDYARQDSRTPEILAALAEKPARAAGAAIGPNP